MRLVLALLAGVLGTVGCTSTPDEFADPEVPDVTTNPDGLAYPTDHVGGAERAATHAGQRVPPFTFQGYKDGDRSRLVTIALADFYDPGQKRYRALHILAAATWCAVCAAELAESIGTKPTLGARGLAYLEVLVSGNTAGFGPSLGETNAWVDDHHSTITLGIDVRGRRFGALGVVSDGMPHDFLVDTRTMEILDSSVGAPEDMEAYEQQALDFVANHAPSY